MKRKIIYSLILICFAGILLSSANQSNESMCQKEAILPGQQKQTAPAAKCKQS